jgi:hypothetical protein
VVASYVQVRGPAAAGAAAATQALPVCLLCFLFALLNYAVKPPSRMCLRCSMCPANEGLLVQAPRIRM